MTLFTRECTTEMSFFKLKTFNIQQRPWVYQLGCKLGQEDALIIVSCSTNTCSLWGSLRAFIIKDILLNPATLQLFNAEAVSSENSRSADTQQN